MKILEFWHFKPITTEQALEITGTFDYSLVLLSICLAVLAAYSSLVVLERIWASSYKNTLNIWLWLGATVMGVGIWAMHYTGMLAFKLPIPVRFNSWITLVSALPSILGAYVALKILSKRLFGFWWIQLGSLALAAGIGTMHFVGMEAMIMDARMHYSIYLFVGSILVAHILATIALYVRVIVNTTENSRFYWRAFSAVIMGFAVTGMHYTAMASVNYYTSDNGLSNTKILSYDSLILSLAILAIIALFVSVTIIATLIDRRLQAAEETAKIREAREHAVVETLADGLIVIDENGKIETFNTSGILMFQQNKDSIIGCDIECLMPDISWQDLIQDIKKQPMSIIGKTIELNGIRSNDDHFPIEVRFSVMNIESKLMFNAVIRDISERKRMEEQLRQSQKLESIGQMAAGIAHEINTPTQYIADNTAFLKKAFPTILDALHAAKELSNASFLDASHPDIQKYRQTLEEKNLDFISSEIPNAINQSLDGLQRVAKIVSAMKSFSHPSEGKKQLTDIQEAIETTATIARNEWKYVADIHFNFDEELPLVPCLRDEFNQVILNIIVNAAHAITDVIDEGKIKKGNISISTKKDSEFAFITITDDGKGMPADIKRRIFDPFFTTKSVGKGTGQGLSIAYTVIVDKHQGSISVTSTENKGTTFTIKLPLLDTSPQKHDI